MASIGSLVTRTDLVAVEVRAEIEEPRERRPALRCHDQPARAVAGEQPALLLIGCEKRGAQRAGEVRPAFGPVDAAANRGPPPTAQRLRLDAKRAEQPRAVVDETEFAVVQADNATALAGLGDRHAEPAGEMVVAGAREAQRPGTVVAHERAILLRRAPDLAPSSGSVPEFVPLISLRARAPCDPTPQDSRLPRTCSARTRGAPRQDRRTRARRRKAAGIRRAAARSVQPPGARVPRQTRLAPDRRMRRRTDTAPGHRRARSRRSSIRASTLREPADPACSASRRDARVRAGRRSASPQGRRRPRR